MSDLSSNNIKSGLAALMTPIKDSEPKSDVIGATKSGNSEPISDVVKKIQLEDISRSPFQPRKKQSLEANDFLGLVESIKVHGVIQPIIVRENGNDKYELIAGERRYLASIEAKKTCILAVVRNVPDNVVAVFALIENIQRKKLTVIEEAIAYLKLIQQFGFTHQEMSERVGRSRSSITNTLRLLELNEYTKEYLEAGHLEMGHARALLSLTAEKQIEAVNKIIDGNLNVRQTEQLVQRMKNPIIKTPVVLRADDRTLLESWRQRLLPHASQVKVKMDAHDNISVNIKCNSPEEAEKLINEIEKLKSQRTTKG